jgi:hypothetical protein
LLTNRDDGKRFVVRANEKLPAFVELQVAIRTNCATPCLKIACMALKCGAELEYVLASKFLSYRGNALAKSTREAYGVTSQTGEGG